MKTANYKQRQKARITRSITEREYIVQRRQSLEQMRREVSEATERLNKRTALSITIDECLGHMHGGEPMRLVTTFYPRMFQMQAMRREAMWFAEREADRIAQEATHIMRKALIAEFTGQKESR